MDKSDFAADTRYTLTWHGADGRFRPLNLYVFRTYETFMVGRETSGAGLLRRIPYNEVERIVQAQEAAPADRLAVPAALLDEKYWRDRTELQHYSSSPTLGK
jgi:hypothetical protein